jgi:hypothetical protein
MATVMMSPERISGERRFFMGMTLVMLVTVVVGFSRSFFLRPLFPEWPAATETIFYVHGAAAAAWIMLLVVQASLVSAGRTGLHRRLGALSAGLAPVVVVLGLAGALVAARRPTGFVEIPIPPLQFLAIPIFDIVLFGAFAWLAIAQRRNAQAHKRWMLLATINMLPAAIARWPGVAPFGPLAFFGIADLFVIALAAWDFRSRGRLHPVTLWGGLLVIVSQPVRLVVSGTAWWQGFAQWLTGLLG